MDFNTILLIIAVILALPGGLFVAWLLSIPKARILALLGGIVGGVLVAVAIYIFLQMENPSLDALSFWVGAFFACSTGVALGALLTDFLVGLVRRRPDVGSFEY